MANSNSADSNKTYIVVVSVLTFILPLVCSAAQILVNKDTPFTFDLVGKWFIFSAVGLRLFIAGIKQTTDPAFTAKHIFHLDNPESFPIVRELFLCFYLNGEWSARLEVACIMALQGFSIFSKSLLGQMKNLHW